MIWNKQFKKARKSDKKARTRNKIFFQNQSYKNKNKEYFFLHL